jgi:hypothetical protein
MLCRFAPAPPRLNINPTPKYVRLYVKAQKNDGRDAEAIAEAATRPTARCNDRKDAAKCPRFVGLAERQVLRIPYRILPFRAVRILPLTRLSMNERRVSGTESGSLHVWKIGDDRQCSRA